MAFISWIPRIPFAALMLKTTIRVSRKYGHVYLVSFIGGLLAVALSAWFSVTLTATYVTYEPSRNNPKCANGSCNKGKVKKKKNLTVTPSAKTRRLMCTRSLDLWSSSRLPW